MKKARSGLREILEERLKALNNQWDKLQDHASARQKDLEQLVQDKADNEAVSGEDSSLASLRNNTALLSSLYFNTENEVRIDEYLSTSFDKLVNFIKCNKSVKIRLVATCHADLLQLVETRFTLI